MKIFIDNTNFNLSRILQILSINSISTIVI